MSDTTDQGGVFRPPPAFWVGVSVSSFLLLFAMLAYGLPIDGWTWAGLLAGLLLVLPLMRTWGEKTRVLLVALPILFYLSILIPWESTNLQDVRGGRMGVRVLPHDFRFGRSGPNTSLLERHLGYIEPEWRHRTIRSMLISDWRDGNERVNSRSVIRLKYLPEILNMLPTDDARQQVLRCVTDHQNLMRVHQGLLLVCLRTMGCPPGYDAERWWAEHRWVFVIEYDAERAARTVFGWTEETERFAPGYDGNEAIPEFQEIRIQRRATRYQERGSWGGDQAFAEAYWNLVFEQGKGRDVSASSPHTVVWWPSR